MQTSTQQLLLLIQTSKHTWERVNHHSQLPIAQIERTRRFGGKLEIKTYYKINENCNLSRKGVVLSFQIHQKEKNKFFGTSIPTTSLYIFDCKTRCNK